MSAIDAALGPRFSADELRHRLGLRYQFSEEQLEVISSAADEPLLVVAGAGSGKTELMALRVVWLIVNAHVRPDQVLGLTFTRKAAGELSHRIRLYLGRARHLLGHDAALLGEPTVSTYHSFAARIVREHGMRSGYEPHVRLLTEALCWQLADAVVRLHDSPQMREFPLGQASATAAVLDLSAELAEHLRDCEDIELFTLELGEIVNRANNGSKVLRPVQEMLDRQRGRLALLPLVRAYADRKATLEAMDFGDQLRRAASVARDHPEVAEAERSRFRTVLLDEYQDTSQAQVVLLQSLFGAGHPVTAVGDPCQSIYGWRGASAGTLDRYPSAFRRRDGADAGLRWLTVSWRNAPDILLVANRLSEPLRQYGAPVRPLRAPATYSPRLPGARVRAAYLMSYLDEAAFVADQVVAAWQEWEDRHGGRPTTAVLVRARSQIASLEAALRERGVPVEVVGLGGLLDTPEVRDVVSTLQVLADPMAGASLLRLLAGARWRIGPRDVVALYRRARRIALARMQAPTATAESPAGSPTASSAESLVEEPDLGGGERLADAALAEALDDLGPPPAEAGTVGRDPGVGTVGRDPGAEDGGFSAEGYRRLVLLRNELRDLRVRLDQSLPDLVADVAQTIGLDVEVAVRGGAAGLARAHLDALGDVAARFAAETEGGTLSSFLSYLTAAEEEERGLAPGEVEVVDGAVQILTVHAAKGLEWDVVAVAGLCEDAFPAKPKASDHWLKGMGVLPFPLRGDADGLPALSIRGLTDARDVRAAVEEFDEAWREHSEREERRLAYVAVTRPRHLLLCAGHRWGNGLSEARNASVFLDEIAQVCRDGAGEVVEWVAPIAPDETNPTLAEQVSAVWPADPLDGRREAVLHGASLVRRLLTRPALFEPVPAAPRAGAVSPPRDPIAPAPRGSAARAARDAVAAQSAAWAAEVDLLLAERERERAGSVVEVTLPAHLSVSQLVALRRDPQQLARRLRRPLPEAPDPHARRGTAFHLWLERRFGGVALLDLDDLPGSGDAGAAPDDQLAQLQEAFARSAWADRMPYRVEVPFATTVSGVVVRGRMDAVFRAGNSDQYDVIDWKTGQKPEGADAQAAAIQLAAYRLAWAELAGVDVSHVTAGFHYVRDNLTVRPADLLDEAALADLVARVPRAGR
jgi:DNA helicase-2/ATP-dependent DNA helicase PcrA